MSSRRRGGLAEESANGGGVSWLFGCGDTLDAVGAVSDAPFLDETAESVVRDECEVGQRSACDWTRGVVTGGYP